MSDATKKVWNIRMADDRVAAYFDAVIVPKYKRRIQELEAREQELLQLLAAAEQARSH